MSIYGQLSNSPAGLNAMAELLQAQALSSSLELGGDGNDALNALNGNAVTPADDSRSMSVRPSSQELLARKMAPGARQQRYGSVLPPPANLSPLPPSPSILPPI